MSARSRNPWQCPERVRLCAAIIGPRMAFLLGTKTICSLLDLYQIQHNGDYPTLPMLQTDDANGDDSWTGLATQTNVNGAAGTDFGPCV